MRLANIENQTATVELAYYDCFRLARLLEVAAGSPRMDGVDYEFAEGLAGLFHATGMALQLNADAGVAHAEESLEDMRARFARKTGWEVAS